MYARVCCPQDSPARRLCLQTLGPNIQAAPTVCCPDNKAEVLPFKIMMASKAETSESSAAFLRVWHSTWSKKGERGTDDGQNGGTISINECYVTYNTMSRRRNTTHTHTHIHAVNTKGGWRQTNRGDPVVSAALVEICESACVCVCRYTHLTRNERRVGPRLSLWPHQRI